MGEYILCPDSSTSSYISDWKNIKIAIRSLEEAMGVNQHHDAVSGTAK